MAITLKDTKKAVYITNVDKNTGDIGSIVIPHDFAIGVDGLDKRLVVYGTAKFMGDVQVIGTIFGGSPVKFAGGIKIEGGADIDGVDVGTSITDIPNIRQKLDNDVVLSANLDSAVDAMFADPTTIVGARLDGFQSKAALGTDVMGIAGISALASRVGTTEADISTASTDRTALASRVGTAEADISTNVSGIATNLADLEAIRSKTSLTHFLKAGDSDLTTLTKTAGLLVTANLNSGDVQGTFEVRDYHASSSSEDRLKIGTVNSHKISFVVNNSEAMCIDTAGRVGIGESSPAADLHIKQSVADNGGGIRFEDNNSSAYWNIAIDYSSTSAYNNDFKFWYNGTQKAYLSHNSNVSAIDFTGQHRSDCDEQLKNINNIGLIVSSTGIYKNLEGQALPTINEALPIINLSSQPNDKKVYGVISNVEDKNDLNRDYSIGAFVSVYEKQDNRIIINALGEGAIWITNINGNIENGDFITSSEIPGYGMLQSDDLLHNYTVAKITQDCAFDLASENYTCEEIDHNGITYKRAFVGCTYHCG